MHARTTTAAALAVLALTLTACSSDDTSTTDKPQAAPASPTPSKSSAFLRPTPEQEKTLIAALTAIDPNLTVKESRAISRSVGVCDDIRKGKDEATVVKNAAFRYDGGTASVDEAKAAKIVQAIKDTYCKA
ncbi:hypothetical protein [Streptomyces sp. E5N91]|uniref:hypothetical protein n=1 Tax=Streptomyces sp. E5N91 TaxID=1851996 RepID=UPI000EF62FB9|nr:hypothetical protein [Streptomyces sp. E5N91]